MVSRNDRNEQSREIHGKAGISPDPLGGQGDLNDLENLDTFQIMNGVRAIFGKAAWSAGSGIQNLRPDLKSEREKEHKKEHDAANHHARQMAHLAAWNKQMTTVGGIRMTNEEAQNARQHIIDNAEYYADRAVQEGRITVDEKDAYKSTIRRIRELEDREGRGVATAAEKQESERLQGSKIGREVEKDAGRVHLEQRQEYTNDSVVTQSDSNVSLRRLSAAPVDENLFQGAPKLTEQFGQVTQGPASPDQQPEQLPQPIAPKVAAMGLGI